MRTVDDFIELTDAKSRPCLRLAASFSSTTTYLGGLPSLPPSIEWPSWKGRSLSFLGQIDLGSASEEFWVDWLPQEGLLLFFYDAEQSTWGFDPGDRGSWCVLFVDATADSTPRDIPKDLSKMGQFARKDFELVPDRSLPGFERLSIDASTPEFNEWLEYLEQREGMARRSGPSHQLLGLPIAVQNDSMEEECQLASNGYYLGNGRPSEDSDPRFAELMTGVDDWELLLQIDSDDDVGMMWGDVGMLYFWVKRDEARRRDFSNAWMILQCY